MSITNTNPAIKWKIKSNDFICCDGLACNGKAIEKIEVSAGTFGNVFLNLCPSCKKMFENKSTRSLKLNE